MRMRSLLVLLAVATVATACGGNPPPEEPTPAIDSTAIKARMRQDSIDAANRAAREQAARDSAARARAAAEAAERARMALMNDMSAMIHFDFDKSDIKSEDMANLDRKAAILMANPNVALRISGHADERGSDEYNLALGNRRANSAKRYLVNKGVPEGRITTASFGEERPVAMGSTEDAWAQNRRDEFEITGGGNALVAPQ